MQSVFGMIRYVGNGFLLSLRRGVIRMVLIENYIALFLRGAEFELDQSSNSGQLPFFVVIFK